MCGIAGKLWKGRIEHPGFAEDLLQKMAREMASRGPDGQGVWLDPRHGVGFAHRRLSIIDLDPRANQPMGSDGGVMWVTFNGEIYNYLELRALLKASGRHSFHTESDTEVLLHLYQDYGFHKISNFLNRLRGMFAFALWDREERTLVLARDPIGKKPLYYAETNEGLVFASTVRALFIDPSIPRRINFAALQLYLTLGYIPTPMTAFEGVRKVAAGHYLTARAGGEREIRRYWEPMFSPKVEMDEPDLERLLLAKIRESTRLRMISDVPLGLFLSGGIDSSAVAAMMSEVSSKPVKTFSVSFAGTRHDESREARLVAARFGCEHYELRIDIRPKYLPDLVRAYEEPFADAAAIPTYFMSKAARQYVTVALNGDGGDENFAGYTLRHRAYSLAEAASPPTVVGDAVLALSRLVPATQSEASLLYRGRKSLRILGETEWRRNVALMEVFEAREVDRWLNGKSENEREVFESVRNTWERASALVGLDRELYMSFMLHLPEQLLVKVDRASMAWSLEARSPLLDREVVSFCARIPPRYKLRGLTGKRIFRQALRGIVPDEILIRRKQGFIPPLAQWLRGELRALVEESLLSGDSFVAGWLSAEAVRRLVREHLDGRRDHQRRLYALLNLELWERLFIRGQAL